MKAPRILIVEGAAAQDAAGRSALRGGQIGAMDLNFGGRRVTRRAGARASASIKRARWSRVNEIVDAKPLNRLHGTDAASHIIDDLLTSRHRIGAAS